MRKQYIPTINREHKNNMSASPKESIRNTAEASCIVMEKLILVTAAEKAERSRYFPPG